VQRNEEATLTLSDIFADTTRNYALIVLETTFGTNDKIAATLGTVEIVALNELRLTR
jgi:hypothetical protein